MREVARTLSLGRLALAGESPALSRWLPVVAIVAAVFLWGGSFSAMKIAGRALDPWAMMWARMMVALICLAPFVGRLIPRNYGRGDWKLLTPLVLLMPCLYFYLESHALTYTTSAQAGVVSASVPLLVAAGARLFLAEAVSRGTWMGLVLSVCGVVWLTLAGTPAQDAPNPLLGNVLELGAMICAAGYMLLMKSLSTRYGPWTITALQIVAGALFFLPGVPSLLAVAGSLTLPTVLAVLFMGAGASLGAFGLYNWAITRLRASQASAYINLVPVVAVGMGWIFLGEALNTMQLAGAGCVFLGVWISQRGSVSR
ncbi:DMT family transporter [Desulfovibrio ferrophilus]|uniref:Putative permease, DMT superfamily n=1 Tax=Desulfovibrio ferrophilus TaxID=241368 RepID=A0A2Z6B139_9BACT|nr:DMT family transporter [Desulfovibrio ferrophilus]BBD09221.1 putative permease, DMT superfamily [Desulfovibrio ferrophilus]